ncbi:MAG TPA: XRE family transcriptional regulator [Longimicrobium sp.]|nr:XRE family transcriptional regulator [Longimicrobium sp.]
MAKKFSDLVARMTPESRVRSHALAEQMMREMPLVELRQARNFTQAELAEALGTTQASVSKLERRSDMYLSTLRRLVEAMGGELEITARFPDGAIRLGQLEVSDPEPASLPV